MSFLVFLAFNLSVPLYLRFRQSSISVYARAAGFVEDFFVALELFLLTWVSIPLAASVGLIIHLVLLLDRHLFQQMQLRLKFSHLRHFRYVRTYYASAKELGLKRLILNCSVIMTLHVLGYLFFYRHFHPTFSWMEGSLLLLAAFAAFYNKPAYALENPFFAIQRKIFQKRHEKKTASALTFPNESFQLLDKNYPLWRITQGFHGEKTFNIKIDPEEKPHVILLFLESFSSHAAGYEQKATPHFDKLSQEGILFSNFYSNGTFTYRALLAGLFGIPGGDSTKGLCPYVNIPYAGLPQLMKQAGYTSAFFHNGSLSFDHQRDFLKQHYEILADRNEIEEGPSSNSWGAPDECLMRYTANWLEKQQKPAFMTLFTISNHHPWIAPEGHVSPMFSSVLNGSHQRFLQTTHYSDHALGQLVQLLREKKLSQKTIIFIVGDHAQPLGQHHGNFYYSRFLYEENVKVPLLILADGRIAQPQHIDEIASHVDLLPTVMDLLHLKGLQHGCGVSLLRKHSERRALLNNPYSEGFIGCRKGPWKWIENQLAAEGELYRMTDDPQEKTSLTSAYPEVAESLRLETRHYFQQIYDLHREKRIVPAKPGKNTPSVLNFDFSTSMITDSELLQLIANFPHIEKLNLRDCLLLTDASIGAVLSTCTRLEELNLKGLTDVTDAAFEKGVQERLRHLDISHASISDQGIEKIGSSYLSTLSLQAKNLTDQGIRSLARCGHLVRLKILQAENISEEALLDVLKNNPHLGHLVVQGCHQLTDRFLAALQNHPLELLWILEAPLLTDEGISYLSRLPIRFLTLEGCPLLTEKSISYLSHLNLESAYLNCQQWVHI